MSMPGNIWNVKVGPTCGITRNIPGSSVDPSSVCSGSSDLSSCIATDGRSFQNEVQSSQYLHIPKNVVYVKTT